MSFGDSYADLANRLILRAKSSLELGQALPYDGPLVRLVIQEQNELEMKIRALEDDGVTTATQRALAYAHHPAGGAAPHVIAQLRDDMSQDEIVYLRIYHESVVEYRQTLSPADVLDIAMGIEDPQGNPLSLQLRVVLPLVGLSTRNQDY
ncbi:hypothetical protein B0H14DRAFT_3537648 [Mycena olivaceomarginata]|nr:hypothetical protein B0H14DRAFT_3537648 [Mycena olivaceomarginata]